MKSIVYPSKVDTWFASILIIALLSTIAIGVGLLPFGNDTSDGWIAISNGAFMAIVMSALSILVGMKSKKKKY